MPHLKTHFNCNDEDNESRYCYANDNNNLTDSIDNDELNAPNNEVNRCKSNFQPMTKSINDTLNMSFNKNDKFKKRIKKTRTIYFNRLKIMQYDSSQLLGLPTGGSVSVLFDNNLCRVNAASTCCIDTLLIVMTHIFKTSSSLRNYVDDINSVNDNDNTAAFITCIKQMASATNEDAMTKARALLFLMAPVFKNDEVVRCPLKAVNKKSFKINVDCSEVVLSSHIVSPLLKLHRVSTCERPGCDERVINMKHIFIDVLSVSQCILLHTTTRTELGICNCNVLSPNQDSDENSTMVGIPALTPLTYIADYITDENGLMRPKIQCKGKRVVSEVRFSSTLPPFILLVMQEPDLNIPHHNTIVCEPIINLFGADYRHMGTTFLSRPKNMYSSGHYVAIININNTWHLYNGLRKNAKPAYWQKLSGVRSHLLNNLDISTIFYARM